MSLNSDKPTEVEAHAVSQPLPLATNADEKHIPSDADDKTLPSEADESAPGVLTPQPQAPDAPTSETQTNQLERVPRSQRRGLLASIALVPEVTNPYNYGNGTKWIMTGMVALAATTSSTGSSIFYPALSKVAADFNASPDLVNLSLAFYMLAMAFTPLWWSMYSELLGRRTIYIISFAFVIIFSAISAVSVNVGMLIAFRVFSGGAAASVQAVGAGTVADVWEPKERGRAMGIFLLGPLCGPALAPIIGGGLTQGFGWRSTLWFLCIFSGAQLLMIIFLLPETKKLKPRQQPGEKAAAADKPKLTVSLVLERIFAPLKVLLLLRHPPVLIVVCSGGFAFGAMFVLFVSIQSVFEKSPYFFTDIQIGLMYLAPTIGFAISSVIGGRWIDHIMKREATKAGRSNDDGSLRFLPEDRLKENIWLSAAGYPLMLIWYGWTADKALPWAVPAVAALFFGLLGMLVFGAVTTVLTEFTPKRSSSGVALNNFMRSILSCIGAVITQPLIDAIGTGWMCTMIGLFTLVTGLLGIYLLTSRGPKWREAMDKKLNPHDD